MSKSVLKKAFSLVLAVVMAVSLSACGKDGEQGGKSGEKDNSLAKQYVYSYQDISMGEGDDKADIRDLKYINGRVYVIAIVFAQSGGGAMPAYGGNAMLRSSVGSVGMAAGAAASSEKVVETDKSAENSEEASGEDTTGTEGGDSAADGDVQVPEEGEDAVTPEEDPEAGVTAQNITRIVSFLPDGSDQKTVELEMDQSLSQAWMGNITFGKDGSIYAIIEVSHEDYSDPENPVFETENILACWNGDGSLKWNKSLKDLASEGEHLYFSSILAYEDGSVHLLSGGEQMKMFDFDSEGNPTGAKEMDSALFANNSSIYTKEDGTLLVTSYNEDYTKLSAFTYDLKTNTASEKKEMAGNVAMFSMYQGTNTDFVLTNNNGVYTYNIGDPDVTQIMSFINSDLAVNYLINIAVIDDSHFVAAYQDEIDYTIKIALFTKVNPEDIPDKEVLVLGANYLDGGVRKHVIDFNKTNQKYRITLKDYSTYNTMEDYTAGYNQLNNDIITGNMPDILIADSVMPVENYVSKGLLADIGSLIEKDEELSKKEFLQNVFRAYTINDKLYSLVPSFTVASVIGKTSVVGDRDGWNMEEMTALMDTLPEGTNSFGDVTRASFLNMVMSYCGSDFVDPSTGKCNFGSQEFINMLEFAKELPEEINYDYTDDSIWKSMETQYRENRTVLMPAYIYGIREMNYTINGTIGEDVTFVGFPCENKNGSVINSNLRFVLSAKSKTLDGAWEFVRYYLTDEYQTSKDNYAMPVEKEAFTAMTQKALERPFYLDENGEKVEYDDTFMLNGEEIKLPPMSQQQIDKIANFIMSVDRCSYYNEDVYKIIEEDAAAFFAGQKSAQEVAQIIQGRVQIYVDENR